MTARLHGDAGQWPNVARSWQQIGPPLRPVHEDLASFSLAIRDWCERHDPCAPRGLILGVTPELYHLPWPQGRSPMAVDRTPEMISYVWPGAKSDVVVADWRQMDLPGASFDVVLCDGGLHLLDFPEGQERLCGQLVRLIAPGGVFAVRLFVPPASRETPREVLDALMAGEIPNLNHLKLRLAMSLQESPSTGVALRQVWLSLRKTAASWAELASTLGWLLEHLSAIDAYRHSHARYHFVTAEQVALMLCDPWGYAFELCRTQVPIYKMGAQCPTLIFRRSYLGSATHNE